MVAPESPTVRRVAIVSGDAISRHRVGHARVSTLANLALPGVRIRRWDGHGAATGRDDVPGLLYQASTVDALMARHYDGDLAIGELRRRGTMGIGTLNGLDGEVVILDGEVFHIGIDGNAHPVADERRTPFAAVVEFAPDIVRESPTGAMTRTDLEAVVDGLIAQGPPCFALRITGEFLDVQARSAIPEQPPYRGFAEAVGANQRIFELGRLDGIAVGFGFPPEAAGLQIPGIHLHLLSADRTRGGHLLDYRVRDARIELQYVQVIEVELPPGVSDETTPPTEAERAEIHAIEGPAAT